jgi:hypothetical protein
MSIGNLRDSGNQSNNFPWQLKMLLGQQCACDQLTQINANTDNVEFLLSAILTTLQAETEYEAKFVVDTCNGDVVYLEVRVWNPDTSTWGPITYYLPGSATPVIPPGASTPGCLQYTDPSAVLALILGAIQAGNVILQDIDNNTDGLETILTNIFNLYSAGQQVCADSLSVTLCTEQGTTLSNIETNTTGLATEVTLGLLEAKDFATETTLALLEGKDFATETTLSNLDSKITACDTTNLATETTLLSVDSNAAQLVTNTTSVTRTPNLVRATGSGTIAPLVYDFSVSNVGSANGTILGGTIKPGETLNFTAGALNNSYAAGTISYNGTGTELVIIFNS